MMKLFYTLLILSFAISCGDGFKKKERTGRTQEGLEIDSFAINQQYLSLVNEYRINQRLTPFHYHFIIDEVSKSHSKGMALHTRPFGHMGFALRCRRLKNRLARHKQCAEIVAMGQKNFRAVFETWMSDPKHRMHLENPRYTHTALGIAKDERGTLYWTQMFVEL